MRRYVLYYEDSIILNKFYQYGANLYLDFPLVHRLKVVVENNFRFKKYAEKSSLEPDYYWNYLRPGFILNIISGLDLNLGYEWEIRRHRPHIDNLYDVEEQNYDSNGIFTSLNLMTIAGTYLSAAVSYQYRRYPQAATNELISIYSNRNLLSVFFMAYIPVIDNLFFNAYITYDNDQDIDLDQQNNQSIMINAELEFKF
jgi:hypothetical protein